MRVAKLRVGILRVEVRAKHASIYVKCETSECVSRQLKEDYSSNQLLVEPISRFIRGSAADPGSRSGFIKEPEF